MEILWGLLLVLLLLVLGVILLPVHFVVDTEKRVYEIYQKGILRFSVHPGEHPLFQLRVMGFPVPISQIAEKKKTVAKPKKRKKRKTGFISRSFSAWRGLLKGLAGSFSVKKMRCRINSGDFVLNAKLFALIVPLNRAGIDFQVDFFRHSLLQMEVELRIYRVLWSGIVFIINK